MKKILAIIFAVLILGTVAYVFFAGITYSDGNRAGYLMKVSKKGFVFKTYEGQLNLGGVGTGDVTAMLGNQIWEFSVADEETYKKLQNFEGRQVKLHYKERLRSFFWQGDTNYFVDDVQLIDHNSRPDVTGNTNAAPAPQSTPAPSAAEGTATEAAPEGETVGE